MRSHLTEWIHLPNGNRETKTMRKSTNHADITSAICKVSNSSNKNLKLMI